jgi:hypothetical protein
MTYTKKLMICVGGGYHQTETQIKELRLHQSGVTRLGDLVTDICLLNIGGIPYTRGYKHTMTGLASFHCYILESLYIYVPTEYYHRYNNCSRLCAELNHAQLIVQSLSTV